MNKGAFDPLAPAQPQGAIIMIEVVYYGTGQVIFQIPIPQPNISSPEAYLRARNIVESGSDGMFFLMDQSVAVFYLQQQVIACNDPLAMLTAGNVYQIDAGGIR